MIKNIFLRVLLALSLVSAGAATQAGSIIQGQGVVNELHGSNIASAATVDLRAATGNYIHITGTTSITSILLYDGAERTVIFDGALTLTNGASLILPGATNITTAAGDAAIFRGDSSGAVRCVSYTKAATATGGAGTYGEVTIDAAGRVTAGQTVTDVAHGGTGASTLTLNNVVLGNGTSAVQFVAPGTSGNALVSNGTTWTSSAVPTGLNLVSSTTIGTQATISLLSSFSSTYDNYRVVCEGLTATADLTVTMQFAVGGVADTGSNYVALNSGSQVSTTATSIQALSTILAAGKGANLRFELHNANASGTLKLVTLHAVSQDSATPSWNSKLQDFAYIGGVVTGFKLTASTSTFSGGTCKIWGYKN